MTNPSTPIPTPRVDALDFEDQMKFPGPGYGELWELARNLERELTQAMEDRDEARGLYMKIEGDEEENYRKIARLTQELDHERNARAELQSRCYDNGFPTGSSIFDEYEAIKRELQQSLDATEETRSLYQGLAQRAGTLSEELQKALAERDALKSELDAVYKRIRDESGD